MGSARAIVTQGICQESPDFNPGKPGNIEVMSYIDHAEALLETSADESG